MSTEDFDAAPADTGWRAVPATEADILEAIHVHLAEIEKHTKAVERLVNAL